MVFFSACDWFVRSGNSCSHYRFDGFPHSSLSYVSSRTICYISLLKLHLSFLTTHVKNISAYQAPNHLYFYFKYCPNNVLFLPFINRYNFTGNDSRRGIELYPLPEKFQILWKFVTSCYCGMTCIKSDLLWFLFKRWDEGQSRSRWIVSLCCHACCSRCFHSVQGLPSALRLYFFFYWYSNFEKNSPKPYFPDLGY